MSATNERPINQTGLNAEEQSIGSLFSTVLDLPPSCIEFSRLLPDYFVVGTYNLQREEQAASGSNKQDEDIEEETSQSKKPQTRDGSLLLFEVDEEQCKLIHTTLYPSAILDLHFSPHNPSIFAIASSTGAVSFFSLGKEAEEQDDGPQILIKHLSTCQIVSEETLVLSLAWHPTNSTILGVTLSDSRLALFSLNDVDYTLTPLVESFNNHGGLEAWTLAFSLCNTDFNPSNYAIYSGGDDARLRCSVFSTEDNLPDADTELVPLTLSGPKGWPGHEAGVVAILPLPLYTPAGQDIVITGSYDDHVRVYAAYDHRRDAINTRPKPLAEKFIGGGVWRLKFLRSYKWPGSGDTSICVQILASCMHAGSRILEVKGAKEAEWTIQVLAKFEEHKSMNYGSDAQPANIEMPCDGSQLNKSVLCVSTSFYDRLLCLWKFDGEGTI